MSIEEMHIMFRQYAQQMGIQNYRAILPEQIDLMLNSSISDVVAEILQTHVDTTKDRVITDNVHIGQVNALATLYKTLDLPFVGSSVSLPIEYGHTIKNVRTNVYTFRIPYDCSLTFKLTYKKGNQSFASIETAYHNYYYIINNDDSNPISIKTSTQSDLYLTFTRSFSKGDSVKVYINSIAYIDNYECTVDTVTAMATSYDNFKFELDDTRIGKITKLNEIDYLYLRDFQINYKTATKGITLQPSTITYKDNTAAYGWFPVRIIDETYLADCLQDYVLCPRLRTPIIVVTNNSFDIYIDRFINIGTTSSPEYVLPNNLAPYKLKVAYIAKPVIVRYTEDIGGVNVDCDLPSYLHDKIVKHAVDLYRTTQLGSLYAAQGAQKQQQQEDTRNNYQPQQTQ